MECNGIVATFTPDSAVISVGMTTTLHLTGLTGTCLPPDTTPASRRWRGSLGPDSLIVRVDSLTGVVTGRSPGLTHVGLWTASGALLGKVPVTVTAAPPPDGDTITLHLAGPESLLVNDHALLTVTATDQYGAPRAVPEPLVWSSTNGAIAAVTSAGVVTGLSRGGVSVAVSFGSAHASLPLIVRARVSIVPADTLIAWYVQAGHLLAIGDTVQYTAHYVDVNGRWLDGAPAVTWVPDDSGPVRVTSAGVVRTTATGFDVVRAWLDGRLDSALVGVGDVVAGLPATLRVAHTIQGVAPVTFVSNRGDPVTLPFGGSVEWPITSGLVVLSIGGGPPEGPNDQRRWVGVIRPSEGLTLYATGFSHYLGVTPVWAVPAPASPDSVVVRVIQSSAFGVVYLRPHGSPMTGVPELCYFDLGDVSNPYLRDTTTFDIILQEKNPSIPGPVGPELARFGVTPPAGRSVTYVVYGDTPETAGVLPFLDP